MKIGCLGDIPFEVSSEVVRTVSDFQWNGSAEYSTHKRHITNSLVEFTGIKPDEISFDITLSSHFGVNPLQEIERIFEYERTAATLPLVIGEKSYGKYRWVVKSHKMKAQNFDMLGNLETVKVSVSLLEYTKE